MSQLETDGVDGDSARLGQFNTSSRTNDEESWLRTIRSKTGTQKHRTRVQPDQQVSEADYDGDVPRKLSNGGYFADADATKKETKRQRAAEKASRKAAALARRARDAALATFAVSPKSSSALSDKSYHSREDSVSSSAESISDSEKSGTDENDSPWPSSARHGDTPLGEEYAKLRAKAAGKRMDSLGSIEEDRQANATVVEEELGLGCSPTGVGPLNEAAVLQSGTGCAVSIPLSPPHRLSFMFTIDKFRQPPLDPIQFGEWQCVQLRL